MKMLVRLTCAVIACAFAGVTVAVAQPAPMGCTSDHPANAAQTLRCPGGLTIVAEGRRQIHAAEPRQERRREFRRPAEQGLCWSISRHSGANAVSRSPRHKPSPRYAGPNGRSTPRQTRTSVLVLRGRVAVRRPSGAGQVVLGPGDGVDVEPGTAPLVIKRWPQPRVDALLARLGQ